MENKIVKVWFDDGQIFIRTAAGEEKSHPLSWFRNCKMRRKQF